MDDDEAVKVPEAVVAAVRAWERTRKRRLFLLILQGSGATIDSRLANDIYNDETQRRLLAECSEIDLLVDSAGGSLDGAYRFITLLRGADPSAYRALDVFVVDYCKSAATLLALAADNVWLSEVAQLGPLDAQIQDPRNPDQHASALKSFSAVDYLRQHGYEIMDEWMKLMLRRTQLSTADLLSHGIQYTTGLMAPLYGQVDPLYFGDAHRALQTAVEYGKRVMQRYSYAQWPATKSNGLLRTLTQSYPSHGFVIDITEAQKLELHAGLLEDPLAQCANAIVQSVVNYIGFIDTKEGTLDGEKPHPDDATDTGDADKDQPQDAAGDQGPPSSGG